LKEVLKQVEQYVTERFPQAVATIRCDAPWRQLPSTKAQQEYLASRYPNAPKNIIPSALNRGDMSFLLEKLAKEEKNKKKKASFETASRLDKNWRNIVNFEWTQIRKIDAFSEETTSYILPLQVPYEASFVEVTQNLLGRFQSRLVKRTKSDHTSQKILTMVRTLLFGKY
jgi:hypothetical protein